jgi:hypothetical protein
VRTSFGMALMLSVLTRTGAAQEDPGRKLEELKREHDKALRSLQEKFEQERARLEKEFRESREKALRGRQDRGEEKGEPGKKEPSKDLQARVRELEERVERLERKLRGEVLSRGSFEFHLPRPRGMPERWGPWLSEEKLRETIRRVFDELERRGLLRPGRPGERPPEKKKGDRKEDRED